MQSVELKTKKVKSKSYFYKYFRSYFIIIIVSLLTVVLLFSQAQKLIKEQIHIASQNTLNQFFERIDDIVSSSCEIGVAITNNQKCIKYPRNAELKGDKTTYETWEISKMLESYKGERYYDIFVYYPIDDRVISGRNSSLKLDAYCDVFYAGNEDSFKEDFRKVVEGASGKPLLYNMGGKGLDSYLCVAIKHVNARNAANSFTAVLVFDKEYIFRVLQSVGGGDLNGSFLIHNADKETIFSTNKEFLTYNLAGYQKGDISFKQMIEKKSYILQIRESEAVEAYYAHVVPWEYYWEKLFRLYIICSVGTLVTIAIAIFIARAEAKRVYRPLELLIENLKKLGRTDYDDKINSEFIFIEELFQKEVDEKKIMNKALLKGQEIKREYFIYSLLNGNKEDSIENSNNIFSANGIELCSDYFCVVVIHIEQAGIAGNDLESFVISNVFCELINRENKGYMVLLPAGKYAFLINVQKETGNERLIALFKEGKEFLQQNYEMIMTIGVSSIQEGMSGIHTAYEEACVAVKYKYLLGKESIIEYCNVSDRNFEYAPVSESMMLFAVNNYLSGKSGEESAEKLVEEIMRNYGINLQASMETIECFKFETISVISRVMMQNGFWTDDWNVMVQELLESETLQEFIQKFKSILEKICYKQHEKTDKRDVCTKAFEYIETNYAKQQLSLTYLGEIFDITPSYLSKLFKEKYQVSIPEFITRTRINGAKQQLRRTQHSIGKIAEENGFLSSSVFVKSFKKMEGITPGIYRELVEKGKSKGLNNT